VANYNPWQARMARWQKRWPVPIEELRAQAYGVLMIAYENVMDADAEQRRKNILAYCQALATFTKLLEGRPADEAGPKTPQDVIVIGSQTGTNGHYG
jgi:hypothetical protein